MTILWMRHGTSVANVFSALQYEGAQGHNGTRARVLMQGVQLPPRGARELTSLGFTQAMGVGKQLKKRRGEVVVMASCLPRAIETAHGVLCGLGRSNDAVIVVPYVQELGNTSYASRDVGEFSNRTGIRVDLGSFYNYHDGGTMPDLARFHRFFGEHIVSTLPQGSDALVVSHGNLMEAITGGRTPSNTEIWETDNTMRTSRCLFRPVLGPLLGGAANIERLMSRGLLPSAQSRLL